MSFIGDYLIAYRIWRTLTPIQKKALTFPWAEPHPRTVTALTRRGLWDADGPTKAGLAVALCRFIGGHKQDRNP